MTDAVSNENSYKGSKIKGLTTIKEVATALGAFIPAHLKVDDITFVCIGTERSTGDSLGPIVGTILKRKKYDVIGTINDPLHAENIVKRLEDLQTSKYVVAIDACLGHATSVGTVQVANGAVKPGAGVNKDHLPEVGDLAITPIVNVGGFMEYFVLQNTQLKVVINLAEIIASAIHLVMKKREVVEVKSVRKLALV
jgi:putative sporulation protein YyaC